MKFINFITIAIYCTVLLGETPTASTILEKVMNRTEGLNHSFELHILKDQKGKPTKERKLKIWAYWPEGKEHSRLSFVETLAPKNLSGVRFWEHRFKNGEKAKRWMTMPVTGKLKDVSDKKQNKNEFDFSELEITPEIIKEHNNSIIGNDIILDREVVVIESKKTTGKKSVKKLWIDATDFFVLKAEFYTKSGRKSKSITMGKLSKIKDIIFPQEIVVDDIRKKTTYTVSIENIDLDIKINKADFHPKDLQK